MDVLIDLELNRARRTDSCFSLAFFDLDSFKDVNDNYGHLVGSNLLRRIADILRENLRPTDWSIRYGGDEFVVILTGTSKEDAVRIIERIREKIASQKFFRSDGLSVKITASFGIATYPEHGSTKEEIIRMADLAMYHTKEHGKDGITLADMILNRVSSDA